MNATEEAASLAEQRAATAGEEWRFLLREIASDAASVTRVAELRQLVEQVSSTSLVAMEASAELPIGPMPYSRKVLATAPHLEIMLARWRPGSSCLPHDHGESFGLVQVLSGRFRHTTYRADLEAGRLVEVSTERVSSGAVLPVSRHMVHSMGALPDECSVTLHWYAPRITGMVVYAQTLDIGWVVSDDCGAWKPAAEQVQGTIVPGHRP